jgi:hypothetical protein
MESQEMKRELFDCKGILFGGMLIVLALFVTSQAAAAPAASSDKSKTAVRATSTTLDPVALWPIWLSRSNAAKPAPAADVTAPARPITPAVTTVGPRPGIFSSAQGNTFLVQVPARPQARSPFTPPAPWGRR